MNRNTRSFLILAAVALFSAPSISASKRAKKQEGVTLTDFLSIDNAIAFSARGLSYYLLSGAGAHALLSAPTLFLLGEFPIAAAYWLANDINKAKRIVQSAYFVPGIVFAASSVLPNTMGSVFAIGLLQGAVPLVFTSEIGVYGVAAIQGVLILAVLSQPNSVTSFSFQQAINAIPDSLSYQKRILFSPVNNEYDIFGRSVSKNLDSIIATFKLASTSTKLNYAELPENVQKDFHNGLQLLKAYGDKLKDLATFYSEPHNPVNTAQYVSMLQKDIQGFSQMPTVDSPIVAFANKVGIKLNADFGPVAAAYEKLISPMTKEGYAKFNVQYLGNLESLKAALAKYCSEVALTDVVPNTEAALWQNLQDVYSR